MKEFATLQNRRLPLVLLLALTLCFVLLPANAWAETPRELEVLAEAPSALKPGSARGTGEGFYLVGSMTDWSLDSDYMLIRNGDAETEEYLLYGVDLSTKDMLSTLTAFSTSTSGPTMTAVKIGTTAASMSPM